MKNRYWDLSFNNYNYSYVNVATDHYGYCTLSFDRLGIGNSSHGEPLNEIQSYIEVAATAELTKMLRNGTFPAVNHTFDKVVHVGHSFGSAQTYALANLYPNITDGIVLTGFSMNSSFVGFFAAGGNFQQAYLNQPLRFSNFTGMQAETLLNIYAEPLSDYLAPLDLSTLPMPQTYVPGYLTSSDAEANKYLFLKPHYYDPAILQLAEKTKQPVTEGELLTLGSLVMMSNYAGPVMVIDGGMYLSRTVLRNVANKTVTDSDLPYCGSDCTATGGVAPSLAAMVKMNFPNVATSNFSSYIQPNTAHGLNFHYNATAGYNAIQEFLGSKNLQSS